MHPWIPIFFKFYGIFILSLTLLYGLGRILLHLISPLIKVSGFYQKIFFSLALGTFSTIIIASIIITHFITISTGFLLIGLFLFYELYLFKKDKGHAFHLKYMDGKSSPRKTFIKIAELLVIALIFYSWQAVIVLKSGTFPYLVPERDYVYYADLSEIMWKTGQENNYLTGNIISEQYFGLIPYHYFELWLGSFFSWLYGCENLLAAHLIVYPLFFVMMSISVFSVVESVSPSSIKKRILALALLFIGAIPFILDNCSDYCKWLTGAESPFIMEKASSHYWIAMIGFLFILNNFFTLALIVFMSIIFTSATVVPGMACGGIVLLFLCFWFKWQSRNDLVKLALYFSATLLFYFAMYGLSGNMKFSFRTFHPVLYYTDLSPVLEKGWDFFTLKVALAELAVRIYKIPFNLFILLSPYFILIYIISRGKGKQLSILKLPAIFIFSAYIGAVISYGIFYKMFDSGQFMDGLYFFIFSLITMALIILLNQDVSVKRMRFAVIVIVCIFVLKVAIYSCNRINQSSLFSGIYSDDYLQAIALTNLNDSRGLPGVCFRALPGKERMTGRNVEIANRIGGYTDFLPQYSQTVNLSLIEMKDWDQGRWGELEKIVVKSSPFYQYVEEQKNADRFSSIAQSQLDFIDEFNIRYAIAEKNASVDPLIMGLVKKTITDSISGERFMLLNF